MKQIAKRTCISEPPRLEIEKARGFLVDFAAAHRAGDWEQAKKFLRLALAQRVPHFTLVTQNVDDLHERAGSPAVLHLHGELTRPYCEACRRPFVFPAGIPDVPEEGARIEPPRCEACGARVRPGVVWFGESLPEAPWRQAREAAQGCNVFLCVGTSALVYPAASLAQFAIAAGAVVVEINPNPAELGAGVITLRGTAGTALPQPDPDSLVPVRYNC